MKLPVYLTKKHLKRCRQYVVVLTAACIFYSGVWIVVEILSHFSTPFEEWSRGNFGMLIGIFLFGLVPVGVGRFLWKCSSVLSIHHRFDDTDVSIAIHVGDIFCLSGAYVISSNTTFDTDITGGLISSGSLQGQFTKRYYDKEQHLDKELEESLRSEAFAIDRNKPKKNKRYEIGTIAKVSPRNQVAYFVAIAELNSSGIAYSSLDNVRDSLRKLWSYIRNHGGLDRLVIPVLGTGRARIDVPRQVMVQEIIRSFIDARYSGNKFCEDMTIVIHEHDYRRHDMNLREFGDYIRIYAKQQYWQRQGDRSPIGSTV